MIRPFVFLAGEWAVTMPLVFSREPWQHSMTAKRLVANDDGTVRRDGVNERIQGIVYFASVDNTELHRTNLKLLASISFPCWPNPARLLEIDDRHIVISECVRAGLVDHEVRVIHPNTDIDLPRPFVLKTGNEHRGIGKHLIQEGDAIPKWSGLATAEPFFVGTSARVLIIGDHWFGIRFDNPTTWIKNAAGADLEMWPDIPQSAVDHAHKVHKHFGLEISGVDYVIDENGKVHFLEINQFPGVGVDDAVEPIARSFLATRMNYVEQLWNERA